MEAPQSLLNEVRALFPPETGESLTDETLAAVVRLLAEALETKLAQRLMHGVGAEIPATSPAGDLIQLHYLLDQHRVPMPVSRSVKDRIRLLIRQRDDAEQKARQAQRMPWRH